MNRRGGIVKMTDEPVYLFDSKVLEEDVKSCGVGCKGYKLAFSVKTNNHPSVIQLLVQLGLTPEVVSEWEFELLQSLNYNGVVIVNGPVKPEKFLMKLAESNCIVQISSFHELVKYTSICKNTGKPAPIVLRLNPNGYLSCAKFSRFGIELNDELFSFLNDNPHILLQGVHFHWPERSMDSFEFRLDFIRQTLTLLEAQNFEIRLVNLGGGMPSRPLSVDCGLDPKARDNIFECLASFREEYPHKEFFIEPGTAIMANCFEYECAVIGVDYIGEKYFVQTNGSIYDLGKYPSDRAFEVYRDGVRVHSGSLKKKWDDEGALFLGSSCIEADIFGGHSSAFRYMDGDKIRILGVGSYSYVFKSNFITAIPKVIDKANGKTLTTMPGAVDFLKFIGAAI